jgi:Zn finger protein HypA/HybF involved in hydrogenase expression
VEYLKEKQYYEDLYDLKTIKDCLDFYRSLHAKLPKVLKLPNKENLPKKKRKEEFIKVMNMAIVSMKISRFEHKEKALEEWMEKDKKRQEKFDNTEPLEIYCEGCTLLMEPIHMSLWEEKDVLRVSFIYNCPKCNKRKAYYDDGEEYKSKPTLCEKCGSEIDIDPKIDDKKDTTTWTYKCSGCDYKKVEVEDDKKWREDRAKEEARNKELLTKFKKDFVFSEEEGRECLRGLEQLKTINENFKKSQQKKEDPAYHKAIQVKKIKVVELNKLLKEVFPKEGYIELQFEKPDMGKFVAVPFMVQDEKSEREEYDSKKQLKRLIDKTLAETNWKLMSDGVSYRVGYLSGKLRCYETEEELMKIVTP